MSSVTLNTGRTLRPTEQLETLQQRLRYPQQNPEQKGYRHVVQFYVITIPCFHGKNACFHSTAEPSDTIFVTCNE